MKSSTTRWLLVGIVLLLFMLPAYAADQVVTNTNNAGAGSLRQAILDVGAGETITFDLPSYPGIITLTTELYIGEDRTLTITGPGADQLRINGNGADARVFSIYRSTVTISSLTLANGVQGTGGAIYAQVQSTVTLIDCVLRDNTTSAGGFGGAIYNYGSDMTLTRCTVTNNTADAGGAIGNNMDGSFNAATLTLEDCTLSGNTATGATYGGGAIFNVDSTATLTNCTLSNNEATDGGSIYNRQFSAASTVTLTNCTVTNNTAATGGGILNFSGTVQLSNSILSENDASATDPDYSGALVSNAYNLIENVNTPTSITGDTTGNITGQAPSLGPLQDNGGPTFTHALLAGSPALDAIPEGGNSYNGAPTTDQRGESRPYPAAGNCDIGAYEVQAAVAADTPPPNSFGGSSGCGANRAPVPNAGPDQTVRVGERVVLDGSASYDPDEGIPQNVIMGAISPQYVNQRHANLQFRWEIAVLYYAAGQPVLAIPDGADVLATVQGFDSEIGSFVPNVPGIYQFDLFITDDYGDSVSDRISITCFPNDSADEQAVIESTFVRFIVSPNPFDDQVQFRFIGEDLAEFITVSVFDLSGHRVWEGQVADADELSWDGRYVDGRLAASAPYIYILILIENGRTHTATGKIFIQR